MESGRGMGLRRMLTGGSLLLLGLLCCTAVLAAPGHRVPQRHRGKKILWIDSYHAGYEWSAGIERGIRDALAGSGVELTVWRMDTKRNKTEQFGRQAGLKAKAALERLQPDLVIASDDNAQQYLVEPFLKGTDLPVVFCGVNQEPARYGYPCRNVTGMAEVELIDELVDQLSRFARGDRLGVLAGDNHSMRAIAARYRRHLSGRPLKVYLVHTFEEYRQAFVRAQQENDMLLLHNNAGIEGWDSAAAAAFLTENVAIPTGSVVPWMAPCAMLALVKLPEEQGEYAGRTALRILDGIRPGDLPLASNKLARLIVNLRMTEAAGLVVPVSLLKMADVIGREVFEPPVAVGQ